MKPYIFIERNGIYIIDLQKTVRMIEEAYDFMRSVPQREAESSSRHQETGYGSHRDRSQARGRVLREPARLGGTLTNIATIRKRIQRLIELESGRPAVPREAHKRKRRSS
jgi:small subunit ribosomal protein S2